MRDGDSRTTGGAQGQFVAANMGDDGKITLGHN
jgi:hypothetical protein